MHLWPVLSRRDALPAAGAGKFDCAGAWYFWKPVGIAFGGYMAKTFSGLWKDVISFDSLFYAYKKARKGKRKAGAVMAFEADLEGNLIDLHNKLIWGQYRVSGYKVFSVLEPKLRKITALSSFADRVLQHSIVSAIEPIWESRFISDSYACRIGKGTHAGVDRVQSMLRECAAKHGAVYALKADISKYFASIDHGILKRLLRKRIADAPLLAVLDRIIDSYSEHEKPGFGIPIGNLTSQLFANIYLDELDQWIKCRRRERWYVRYMDDFVVIHHSKEHLQALLLDVQLFLSEQLSLETNHKTQVFPVAIKHGRGLDFLGYHLWPNSRRLRRAAVSRFKRRLKRLQKDYSKGHISFPELRVQLLSYINHARHGDALPLVERILDSTIFTRG